MRFPFLRKFPFADRPDTAVLVCCHVLAGRPVLYASRGADDGMWQFLCGGNHRATDARIIALKEALELDSSIGVLKALPGGSYAQRQSADGQWVIHRP